MSRENGRRVPINMRVPADWLDQIDRVIQQEKLGRNRTAFIVQAVTEKLEKEGELSADLDSESIRLIDEWRHQMDPPHDRSTIANWAIKEFFAKKSR